MCEDKAKTPTSPRGHELRECLWCNGLVEVLNEGLCRHCYDARRTDDYYGTK